MTENILIMKIRMGTNYRKLNVNYTKVIGGHIEDQINRQLI